jgi:acyl-CoA-binding protein
LQAKATREGFLAAWEEMKGLVKEKSKETYKEVVSPFDV